MMDGDGDGLPAGWKRRYSILVINQEGLKRCWEKRVANGCLTAKTKERLQRQAHDLESAIERHMKQLPQH